MADKHVIDQLMKTLSNLHHEIVLLDADGFVVPGGEKRNTPFFSDTQEALTFEGCAWVYMPSLLVRYVCVRGTNAAALDCAKLAAALTEAVLADNHTITQFDVVRSILREELSAPELDTLAAQYGIPMNMERCVVLLHGASPAMKELIQVGDDDLLVDMDRHVLVLIKSMDNMEGYEDLQQLAEAVEQTIMSEIGEQPILTIGEAKPTLHELGASYRAAWRALEIGRMFHPDRTIYAFNRLSLERFLSEINRDLGMCYHQMLFNRKTQRLFNDEMLHTIDMFFNKDLNLSDTARQLYIHRNTLVYRLDKIQRQTGLDLRRFEDAITFRILLLLGKCNGDKPASVR
jgi:carbohydrate diacid regulator